MLKQSLIEKTSARDLSTVYRHDEERGPLTLHATPLAYSTLGITDAPEDDTVAETPPAPVQRRSGTKQEALIAMLRAPDGATIEEIASALTWRSHTVRGAIAGALKKKLGLEVTSETVEGRGRVYRLESN